MSVIIIQFPIFVKANELTVRGCIEIRSVKFTSTQLPDQYTIPLLTLNSWDGILKPTFILLVITHSPNRYCFLKYK